MVKKGDTLIEVTLAVGIFSMIAIAITAVMSSGTAGAQTALETTLTREEIDTQAEALRFIQTAYSANKDSADDRFSALWNQIKRNAIDDIGQWSAERQEGVLQYSPNSCAEVFDNNSNVDINDHAFIINPRKLGTFTSSTDPTNDDGIFSVYIPKQNSGVITQATIYPRLIFTDAAPNAGGTLVDETGSNNLLRAEGIYVIAVKDSGADANSGNTSIVGEYGIDKAPAYYDFYIRTCWYGTDADTPSTISTVIRLYDPDVAK